jgi:hypothetical protein
MSHTLPVELAPQSTARATSRASAPAIPWFVWSGAIAISSIAFGLYWDISWHQTIGRDTFWTPAHLAIHFGGILAAITCTYLIFSTTFSHDPHARDTSVGVWGFRGPLGAFVTAWGGVTMLTSAPFDNWWHNSFGLDVEILSPPHVVLGLGILGVGFGALLLLLSQMNRADGAAKIKLTRLFLYLGAVLITLRMILISEYTDATMMHTAMFYRVLTLAVPSMLVAFARASRRKWGATIVASIYSAITAAFLWILPLFPAHPRLGPVLTNVNHMVPMAFPVLLVPAAFALDFAMNRVTRLNKWLQSAIAGTVFLLALIIVHWPWGTFMISPLARNWFFGQNYFPYQVAPSEYHFAWEFQKYEATRAAMFIGFAIAWVSSIITTRIGIFLGDWFTRVRR